MTAALVAAVAWWAVAGAGPTFLRGGDISLLPLCEQAGVVYRSDDKPGDPLAIMAGHGCNTFRVRLFVDPDGRDAVRQDLAWVRDLGRRIKARHAVFLLAIHYSDTWADPGRQTKPAAWDGLDFVQLTQRIADYSAAVVATLVAAGARPDIIQLGNEITPGFLWPDGRLDGSDQAWQRCARLLRAAADGVRRGAGEGPQPDLMIHLHCGGDAGRTAWFLENMARYAVPCDVVGLSYYPWWQGGRDGLVATLEVVAEHGYDALVVETAFPWQGGEDDTAEGELGWARTPAGQAMFLRDVLSAVRGTPGGHGRGVLWWAPEVIAAPGVPAWRSGRHALFGADGNALPALAEFAADAARAADLATTPPDQ